MLPSLSSLAASTATMTSAPTFPQSLALGRPDYQHHLADQVRSSRMENVYSATAHHDATPPGEQDSSSCTAASRAKSNSERGKLFRAKRKKYEGELETIVYKLRTQVAELDMRKGVWEKQFFAARHTDSGSLVQLICEYFKLFRFGLQDPDLPEPATVSGNKRALMPSAESNELLLEKIRKQEQFITSAMDSDVLVGEKCGPAASLAQWRMYTVSHDSLRNEPSHIITTGSEEHPCVEVHSNIYGRISRDTFRFVFPGAMDNEPLVQKFLHRDVVYKSVFRFHFTEDNKIAIESADIGIVEGLQDAGFSLDDISQLMQETVLTPQCMIPEPDNEVRSPSPPIQVSAPRPARQLPLKQTKLSLGFLLGDDELRPDERVEEINY